MLVIKRNLWLHLYKIHRRKIDPFNLLIIATPEKKKKMYRLK